MNEIIKILIIDDDADFLTVTSTLLKKKNKKYKIETISSSVEALEKLKIGNYDLIICDYDIPVYNGLEILEKIRERENFIPFIVLTGKSREQVVIEALNKGADYYLQKGFDSASLITELHNIIKKELEKVSDRRKSERIELELRKSEEKFRMIADNTYNWETWIGRDKKFIYTSPACLKITGYCSEEFYKNPDLFLDIIAPEDLNLVKNHLKQEFESKEELTIDFRIMRKDEKIYWLAHSCKPVINEKGKLLGRRASNRDITDQIKIQNEMRHSEKRYRQLIEFLPLGVFVHIDGRIVFINEAMKNIIGAKNKEEIIGREVMSFVHPDYLEIVKKRIKKSIVNKEKNPIIREKFLRLGGISIDVEVATIPIIYENSSAVQGVVRDITEESVIKDEIKHARDQLDIILRSINDSIVVLDENFDILFLNTAAAISIGFESSENLLAKTSEEITDRFEICDKDGKILSKKGFIKQLIEPNPNKDLSTIIVRNNITGKETWYELTITEVLDSQKTKIRIVVGHNLTDIKAKELELTHQKEETSLFLDIISHDMTNYLSIIKGSLDLIDYQENISENNELLENAKKSSLRSMELINNISILLKQQLIETENLKTINLLDTLKKTEILLREVHKDKKLNIKIKGITRNTKVKADALIDQVFFNIMNNSVKYDKNELVKIEIKLESDKKKSKNYTISFTDHGKGIAPKEREKLFTRFTVFKTKGKGSGLGLYIVKTLVERYKGKVSIENTNPDDYRKGTKVMLQLKAV
ncbi:MAG: Sporulation kinase A [Candidatus Heimdallarchaeota archaeon LC_3]|nr:MAG: Sporulation kinase A [Candidatus Heimdallarchaeota archaeon LC_3]